MVNLVLDKEAGLLSQLSSVSLDKVRKEGHGTMSEERRIVLLWLRYVVGFAIWVAVQPAILARRQGEQRAIST